jgi:hypothetical protein
VAGVFCGLLILGGGSTLVRLRKVELKVEQLEQLLLHRSVSGDAIDAIPMPDPTPAKKNNKVWIIPLIVVLAVLLIVGGVALLLKETPANPVENPAIPLPQEPVIEVPTEPLQELSEAVAFNLNETFGTDFVEICFTDITVAQDIKYSVTTGNVTRITGPEPVAGQQYICLSGTICNTSTSPLPVYDFFVGNFCLDGYNYEVTANDCDILDGEGQTKSEIDPLMEYVIRIYVAVPDSLATSYGNIQFSFGFHEGFDNYQLSSDRAFEEDPIALCPYRFIMDRAR